MRWSSGASQVAVADPSSERRPDHALEAGIQASVLADIGSRALIAVIGRGAVIVGEGSGGKARAIIVDVADRVGQRPISVMVVVAMMARLRNAGRDGYRGQDGGGGEKLHFGHLDSPQKSRRKRQIRPL